MTRVVRVTNCPMCGTEVTVHNSRPGANRKKYCERCRAHPKRSQYRQAIRTYGISFEECERLYSIQECECCGKDLADGGGPGKSGAQNRQIDHCHETGKIRGVLCWTCNVGIGHLGDTVESVENALKYLKKEEE